MKELVVSVNGNLVFSLLNLMDTFIEPLRPKAMGLASGATGRRRSSVGTRDARSQTSVTRVRSSISRVQFTDEMRHRLEMLTEPWFIFALIWSIGATADEEGRTKFSEFLR
jgi:dynein heavy chain